MPSKGSLSFVAADSRYPDPTVLNNTQQRT